jgi:N,N'-diacetyllegionaminate synthase
MKKNKVIIIAEAGVNHNGKLSLAKKMIDIAVETKVDYIKFQFFNFKELTTKWSVSAGYQLKNTKEKKQQNLLQKLSLSFEELKILENYAKRKKIKFMLSIFDFESLKKLKSFKTNYIKIPSGEINNLPFIEKVSNLKKKIILSTGGSSIKEIQNALKILKANKVILLHCVTNYPASPKSVNLNSLKFMEKKFKKPIGLSDHTLGISIPIAATALGARVIEKHFTLSRKMKGPDHKSSLEPKELKDMVNEIRKIEVSLGKFNKIIQQEEKKNILLVRKSIVAKKIIIKGEKFTKDNLTVKRPGTGLSPSNFKKLIGLKAKKKFKIDELIYL